MVFGFTSLETQKIKTEMRVANSVFFVLITFYFSFSTNCYAQINFCGEELPLSDKQVSKNLLSVLYKVNHRSNPSVLLKRAKKYFPYVEEMLHRYNIPQDFKYLPIIESGFYNYPPNQAGAAGAWSLTENTARSLGLKIGNGIDERMDFEKATIAALKFIKWLYKNLGSWTLTAAAYNGGLERIQQKIKKSEHRDYYKLSLCRETAEYVLKIVTIKELFKNQLDIGALVDNVNHYDEKGGGVNHEQSTMVNIIETKVSSTISKMQGNALFNSRAFNIMDEEIYQGELIDFQKGRATVKFLGAYSFGDCVSVRDSVVIKIIYKNTPWESLPIEKPIPGVKIRFNKQ
jgi:hypothetical protein